MKAKKGITLLSLTIYVTFLCVVIAMLSMLSNLFYANTQYLTENSKNIAEYNKFSMYFIEDVKNNKNMIFVSKNQLAFEDGTVYTYTDSPDNSIYRNKVKICKNIGNCQFSQEEEVVNGITKKIIKVYMVIKSNKIFETNNQYVLKYW